MAKQDNSQSTRQPRNRTDAQTPPNRQRSRATGTGNPSKPTPAKRTNSRRTSPTVHTLYADLNRLHDQVNGLPTNDTIQQEIKRQLKQQLAEVIDSYNVANDEGGSPERLIAIAGKLQVIDDQLMLLAGRVTVVENDVEQLKGNHERLAGRIDDLMEDILPNLERLRANGGSVSNLTDLIVAGFTAEQRERLILMRNGNLDMSEDEFAAELIHSMREELRATSDTVAVHSVEIHEIKEDVAEVKARVNVKFIEYDACIDKISGGHMTIATKVDDHEKRLKKLEDLTPVLIGLFVTAIVASAIWIFDWCKGWPYFAELGIALAIGVVATFVVDHFFDFDDEDEKSDESKAEADDTKGTDEPDNNQPKRRRVKRSRRAQSQSTQSSTKKEGSDEKTKTSPAPAVEDDLEPDYVGSRS